MNILYKHAARVLGENPDKVQPVGDAAKPSLFGKEKKAPGGGVDMDTANIASGPVEKKACIQKGFMDEFAEITRRA